MARGVAASGRSGRPPKPTERKRAAGNPGKRTLLEPIRSPRSRRSPDRRRSLSVEQEGCGNIGSPPAEAGASVVDVPLVAQFAVAVGLAERAR